MMSLFKAPITAMMMGGLSFLLTMFFLLTKPLQATVAAQTKSEHEEGTPESFWKVHNPEIDVLLSEVRREKDVMAKREAQLRELETRLQAERAEINTVTQRVAQLQAEFDQNIIRVKEEELPSLKKLGKLYSSMSPDSVLAIFKEMDDPALIKILKTLKESESAPLLDLMAKKSDADAKRAAFISEALTRTIIEKKKSP
jgi:flagellar motility protein MotE (MotC chaperone)